VDSKAKTTRPPSVSDDNNANQAVGPNEVTTPSNSDDLPTAVSFSKVEKIETPRQNDISITGNRIIDVEVLVDVFQSLCCPDCCEKGLRLHENFSKKRGLASLLTLKCKCGYYREFYTTQKIGQSFDINQRIIYAMRSCGQGYSALERLTALLNMPRPMTKMNFNSLVKKITDAVVEVANKTMSDAANKIREKSGNPDDAVNTAGIS